MHATLHIFTYLLLISQFKFKINLKQKTNHNQKEKDLLTDQENGTIAIVKAIDSSLQEDDGSTTNWKGER